MPSIRITPSISIDEDTLEERFVLASGPGGQNVNKVATAVQLRFDVSRAGLSYDVQARLATLAGRRLTKEGVLLILANRFRTQERNRADARERLMSLIAEAAIPPRLRVKTKVSRSAKRKRVDDKTARGQIKRGRSRPSDD